MLHSFGRNGENRAIIFFFSSLIPDSAIGFDMRASTVVQLLQLLTIMFNLMAESVRMSDINNFHV